MNIILGDCREEMAKLPANSVDAIVTDPPYCLTSQRVYSTEKQTEEIGGDGTLRRNIEQNTAYGAVVRGFMGKEWDNQIALEPGVWREALRVAKPGAHLLAFGGSRTYHRLACAVEDAGWEIRDQIMWVYGSGFPKSLNISKAIDKEAGAVRRVIGRDGRSAKPENTTVKFRIGFGTWDLTEPATDAAKQWNGWGTALKPAHEPIVVARKPLEGTTVENVLKWGTGGINVDGCRVGCGDDRTNGGDSGGIASERPTGGRFPANLIHDGSEEVVAGFPKTPPTKSAARFFYCAKASREERENGLDGFEAFQRDTTRKEGHRDTTYNCDFKKAKNHHPTVKPIALMRYLCRLVTPPGGTILDPFLGSGTTAIAAYLEGFDCIGIEKEAEYAEIAKARVAYYTAQKRIEREEQK